MEEKERKAFGKFERRKARKKRKERKKVEMGGREQDALFKIQDKLDNERGKEVRKRKREWDLKNSRAIGRGKRMLDYKAEEGVCLIKSESWRIGVEMTIRGR